MTQRGFQSVISRIADIQLVAVALEVRPKRPACAVNHSAANRVIDAVFTARSAGDAICTLTGLTDAQAERRVAWVVVGVHA